MKINDLVEHDKAPSSLVSSWLDDEKGIKKFIKNAIHYDNIDINSKQYDIILVDQNSVQNYFIKHKNIIYAFMQLEPFGKWTKCKKLETNKNARGQGFAIALVNYFCNKGLKLISDDIMSDDAENFWKKIANGGHLEVFVVDIKFDKEYHWQISKKDKTVSDDGQTIVLSPEEDIRTDFDINDTRVMRTPREYRFFWGIENKPEFIKEINNRFGEGKSTLYEVWNYPDPK